MGRNLNINKNTFRDLNYNEKKYSIKKTYISS